MKLKYLLDQMEAKSGNALKEAASGFLSHNSEGGNALRRYVMAVLDPAVTYGVKGKLKPVRPYGGYDFDDGAYAILAMLAPGKDGKRELSGNAAKKALEEFVTLYNAEAVELMNRALNKDLRCGVGVTLINSLGLDFKIPVFTCQLAQPGESKRMADNEAWLASIKFDGMRALIEVADNRVAFWSRSGKPITALDALAPAVLEIFGGNRLMLDSEGVGTDFLDTVSQLRRKSSANLASTTVLQVFDILDLDDFRAADTDVSFGGPLTARLERLMGFMGTLPDEGSVRYVSHEPLHGWSHFAEISDYWMSLGLEGGIAKRAAAGYNKRRTHDWLKIKTEDEITSKIVDLYEGEAGKQFEGMLGGAVVHIDGVRSDIGGGWSHEERARIWAAYTGRTVEFEGVSYAPDEANNVLGRLIDIKANGKNPSGALRHGRKVKFRDLNDAQGVIA